MWRSSCGGGVDYGCCGYSGDAIVVVVAVVVKLRCVGGVVESMDVMGLVVVATDVGVVVSGCFSDGGCDGGVNAPRMRSDHGVKRA